MKPMLENIKGIIFDYGGTLDSEGRHWSYTLREGLVKAGICVDDEAWRDAYVFAERALARERIILPEDTFLQVMQKKIDIETKRLAELAALNLTEEERVAKADIAAGYCYNFAREHVEQSKKVLRALAAKGYPMVLVTNFYGNMHSVLNDFALSSDTGFFKEIVESSVVGIRKPDPRIFALGVEALGLLPQEVLVVGDSYDKDIVPAAKIGCATVWLKGQGWGKDPEDTQAAGETIRSINQLAGMLR